jgi:low temperature requirement protein LtrA
MAHEHGGHGHGHRGSRPWRRPMVARDPAETHRVATPLELLFDLCVVVAVAQAAATLHHGIAHGHGWLAIGFLMAFFAIWWAWMSFTWFASAYDTDDVPYRLLVLVQIAGVLTIAAGVPRAAAQDMDVVTIGYAIMRVGLIALWLRAAASDPERRQTASRYAIGIAVSQVAWVSMIWIPDGARSAIFPMAIVVELLVPIWAERPKWTTWHPHHIAERYGLLTLIVLGESVLASTLAIQAAVGAGGLDGGMISIIAGGLVTLFAMWWIYFDEPATLEAASTAATFVWGYGHYAVFAGAAATGAGIAVVVDAETGAAHLARWQVGAAISVPVAVYLVAVWLVLLRPRTAGTARSAAHPLAAALVLAAGLTPAPLPVIAGILVALVALTTAHRHRAG